MSKVPGILTTGFIDNSPLILLLNVIYNKVTIKLTFEKFRRYFTSWRHGGGRDWNVGPAWCRGQDCAHVDFQSCCAPCLSATIFSRKWDDDDASALCHFLAIPPNMKSVFTTLSCVCVNTHTNNHTMYIYVHTHVHSHTTHILLWLSATLHTFSPFPKFSDWC